MTNNLKLFDRVSVILLFMDITMLAYLIIKNVN
jgi:hypothetical protein